MTQFKTSFTKLVPCRFFPEFLKEGVFLVSSGHNQIFRIREKADSYALLENKNGETIRLEHLEKSNEMLLLFLVNSKIDYAEPDVLFNIEGDYVIAGVFDLMGDQIKGADIIDLKPDQIGYGIKMYGDYREWELGNGLFAHQAYYWVDRIIILDESKMREDGYPERTYVKEYTMNEFISQPEHNEWKEILNTLTFSNIENIIESGEVQIETETIEVGGMDISNIPFKVENPIIRNKKGMICIKNL